MFITYLGFATPGIGGPLHVRMWPVSDPEGIPLSPGSIGRKADDHGFWIHRRKADDHGSII